MNWSCSGTPKVQTADNCFQCFGLVRPIVSAVQHSEVVDFMQTPWGLNKHMQELQNTI